MCLGRPFGEIRTVQQINGDGLSNFIPGAGVQASKLISHAKTVE